MIYATIAQYPAEMKTYEAATMAELATKFALDNGGHYALESEDASIPVYSGKAHITRHDGDKFWFHVMSDVMAGRDNDEFWVGEDKDEIVAKAQSFLDGTYGEE